MAMVKETDLSLGDRIREDSLASSFAFFAFISET